MYYDSNYDNLHLQHGEEVWAYAFCEQFNDNLDAKPYLNQTPILGIIHHNPYGCASFIPYQKNKKDLAMSRKINARSRSFAKTETEAWAAYTKEISRALAQHEARMRFLQGFYNKTPNLPQQLQINQNHICRFTCPVSPVKPEHDTKAFTMMEYPHIPLYPTCQLPNLLPKDACCTIEVHLDKDIVCHHMLDILPHIETSAGILIEGYDKDNNIYDALYVTSSTDEACTIASDWARLQRTTDAFRSSANEPYDWFCIRTNEHRTTIPI